MTMLEKAQELDHTLNRCIGPGCGCDTYPHRRVTFEEVEKALTSEWGMPSHDGFGEADVERLYRFQLWPGAWASRQAEAARALLLEVFGEEAFDSMKLEVLEAVSEDLWVRVCPKA